MDCYGHYDAKNKKVDCGSCEFEASCRYYTNLPADQGTKSNTVSMDAGSFNRDGHSLMCHQNPGLPNVRLTLKDLADFARFLLGLDDISLGMIVEVLRGSRDISELAAARGVSRQCVHHKIVNIISRVPELTVLFVPLMPKLTTARRRFLFGKEKNHKGRRAKREGIEK
jgi:hypothetical protein